jgi:hypothetical protein
MALDELAHVSGADLGGGGGGMFLPGYAGGAAQIPQANTINDKSPTNIHDSSGYAGGAAQIPLLQVTVEALPKFDR